MYDVLNMIKYFKLKHNVDLNAFSSIIIIIIVIIIILLLLLFCRRIVLHPSAFDSRVKFLEKTRGSFGGGAFNLSEGHRPPWKTERSYVAFPNGTFFFHLFFPCVPF